VRFRANEEVAVNVVTDAAPEVTHEMIAADEVGASDGAAGGKALVESGCSPTNASHEFSRCVLTKFRGVDPVNVVKKWPLRLETPVEVAAGSPGEFAAHAKAALQKKICTEDWVGPPLKVTGAWFPEALEAEGAIIVPAPIAASNSCA